MTIAPQTVDIFLPPHHAVELDPMIEEDRITPFQAVRSGNPTKPRLPRQAKERKSKDAPPVPDDKAQLLRVPVASLEASTTQPRRAFDPDALQELATSVKARGVLQPILVRPVPSATGDNNPGTLTYEIVAGERRWLASQQAGLEDIPVLVQRLSDAAAAEIGLIENLQREDLTPLETAGALARMTEQGYSIRKLAVCLGKQKGWVEQHLLLVRLPEDLRIMVSARPDTLTHARELEKLSNSAFRAELITSVLDADQPLSLAELRKRIRLAHEEAQGGETPFPEASHPQVENLQEANGASQGTVSAAGPCEESDAPLSAVAGDDETDDSEETVTNETAQDLGVGADTDADGLLHDESIFANIRTLKQKLPAMRLPDAAEARESLIGELSALRDAIVILLGDWGVTD